MPRCSGLRRQSKVVARNWAITVFRAGGIRINRRGKERESEPEAGSEPVASGSKEKVRRVILRAWVSSPSSWLESGGIRNALHSPSS